MPFRGNDAVQFRNLMVGLAATFDREADHGFMLGYEIALDDLPIADITRGVARAIRECRFMPTGAELRQLAGVVSVESRAALAWDCLKRSVALHGEYASVDFDDPAINATVRNMGGWGRICMTPIGDEFDKWLRQQFERVYCMFCRDGFSAEMAQPLIGICDRYNSAAGYLSHVEQPRRITTGLKPIPGLIGTERRGTIGLLPDLRSA